MAHETRVVSARRPADSGSIREVMRSLAVELASAPASEPPYAALCERTLVALGAQAVGLSTYDPATRELEVRFASIRAEGLFARMHESLGARFQGTKMKVPAAALGRMWGVERFEDLTTVSFGAVPRTADRLFRRMAGVGWFWGVALRHQGDLLGSLLVIMPKDGVEVPAEELSLLGNMAAFMVWRHLVEGALRASEARAARGAQAEAVNALARGLAHDVGNVLTAVKGYARMARRDAAPGSALGERLDKIESVAARAAELTQRLLELSPRADHRRESLDLSELARNLAPLLESGLRSPGCVVRFALCDGLPRVRADRSQVEQVALNLAVNAYQAMDGRRGRLTFSTGSCRLGRAALSGVAVGCEAEPGTYAWLQVEDDGCGMTADAMARLFEPGFTTKANGHGYGMFIAKSIVRGHGGAIEVRTAPGKGTAVRVLLPAERVGSGSRRRQRAPARKRRTRAS